MALTVMQKKAFDSYKNTHAKIVKSESNARQALAIQQEKLRESHVYLKRLEKGLPKYTT